MCVSLKAFNEINEGDPQCRANLTQFHHIQPAFPGLVPTNERLRFAQFPRQVGLSQARIKAHLPDERQESLFLCEIGLGSHYNDFRSP